MGLLMQGPAAVPPVINLRLIPVPVFLHLGSHIVKALGTKKEIISWPPITLFQNHPLIQIRMGISGGEPKVPASSLRIHAVSRRNGFQQCRFPCPVLSHKKRNRFFEAYGMGSM